MDSRARKEPNYALAWRETARAGVLRSKAVWLPVLVPAVLGVFGAACALEPPRYYAEAQIQTGPRSPGVTGLRAAARNLNSGEAAASAAAQAQLIASRPLSTRVIKELGIDQTPEFDPGLGLFSRALVFLGIKRDPARQSRADRVLETFIDRLRVKGPDPRGVLSIGVQAGNPEIAANAANRLAELYAEMRADGQKATPRQAPARIVAFAIPPRSPVWGGEAIGLAGAAAAAAFGAFGSCAALFLRRLPLRRRAGRPAVPPYSAASGSTVARVKLGKRLNAGLAAPPCPPPPAAAPAEGANAGEDPNFAHAIARIEAKRAAAHRGIRIFAAGALRGEAGVCLLYGLARRLAREGQTIAICPGGLTISSPGGQSKTPGLEAGSSAGARPGDIVAGAVSFTDVIRRDPASRLHLLQIAQDSEADPQELQFIIDALAGTYDYVMVLVLDSDESRFAKYLIRNSDFALLAGPAEAARGRLIESCAGEVLRLGFGAVGEQSPALSPA